MMFESRRGQNERKLIKHILQFVEMYFLYNVFLVGPLAFHFKDDL